MLPVDNTGVLAGNLINEEYHQISGGAKSIIRPNYGAFFKAGLQIYSVSGNTTLNLMILDVDYSCAGLDAEATKESGKEVYSYILIINPILTSLFSVTYQAYGGINNFNVSAIYSVAVGGNLGITIPWLNLTDKQSVYPPSVHTHDIADVYGMEVFNTLLNNISTAVGTNESNSKYSQVTQDILAYTNAAETYNDAVAAGIRGHIDNISNPHPYTAAMLGVDNLSNYDFTTTTPRFASPTTITAALFTPPAATTTTHRTLTDNPHSDTAATIGLGNVANLTMVGAYTPSTSEYVTLLAPAATQQYIGPYALVTAANEMAAVVYGDELAGTIGTELTAASAIVTDANTVNSTTNSLLSSAATTVTNTNNSITSAHIVSNANLASHIAAIYSVKYADAVLSDVLKQMLSLEYSNFSIGSGTTSDGYLPIPGNIANLELWLSANNPENQLFPDSTGKVRITGLVDKAQQGRVFSALPNVAPILGVSSDIAASVAGITNANVAHFNNGTCLNLSSGTPVRMTSGMTIVALVKTGPSGSSFDLLNNPLAGSFVGISLQSATNQAITVSTGDSWIPMVTPSNSNNSNSSEIVVASISPISESFCWLGSSKALVTSVHPRGVMTPPSSWPGGDYVGQPLTSIGNANFRIANVGEFAELLIYNRQLSGKEVGAVIAYLQLRYSANTALAVDLSALSAF